MFGMKLFKEIMYLQFGLLEKTLHVQDGIKSVDGFSGLILHCGFTFRPCISFSLKGCSDELEFSYLKTNS